MSGLENFKPEKAHLGVLNELRRVIDAKCELRIFRVPGSFDEDKIFVRVIEHNDAVPIHSQRAERIDDMNKSINGFGGCLADMIRSCRFEVEATRKKCDGQTEFNFPKGGL